MEIHFKTLGSTTMTSRDVNNNGFTKNVFLFRSYNKGDLKTKTLCVIPFRLKNISESLIPSNIIIPK